MNKKFWVTTFTLSGTIIGAGILGLPYVFSQSGFWFGIFWLLFLGLIMIYINLCIGETTLRSKGIHHLPGLAEKYLGKIGKRIMFFAVVFGIYSALLAYLIGEGESLSQLFMGNLEYSLVFALGFWFVMTLLLREGLKGLKKVETYGVIGVIVIIIIIFVLFLPRVEIGNLNYFDNSKFFLPFGVTLFALLGFTSVPELRREINGSEKLLRKAIIIGVLIPVVLYFIFALTFVGVLGKQVPEIATLALGNLIVLLGIFTMTTSYFVLSFALKDIYTYDVHESKKVKFVLVSIAPLILYLIVSYFNLDSFVKVLSIGGVISGGITGIMVLIMALNAKKKSERKPEFKIPVNWFIIGVLSLIFVGGIVVELMF